MIVLPVAAGKKLGMENGENLKKIIYFYIMTCHVILPNNVT